jgi:GDP-4-dehydro-6-deoxy-D-mannose reductase
MRRILITGAGGFLAGPLIARLKGRGRLILIRRSDFDLSDPAQAREAVRLARPDEVYHLAGTTRAKDWATMWRTHVSSTIHLLEALSARDAAVKVVVSGSSAEYGTAGGNRRPDERSSLEPVTPYGSCKLAQTLAALSFARDHVSVVAARVFNVLGPGTPENLAPGAFAQQVARAAAGLQPPVVEVGDLTPRRDYVDVRDVAAAFEFLMRRGVSGETYNVGSGRSVAMSAVLNGLAKAAGVKIIARRSGARVRRAEVRNLAADGRKLRALGWSPKFPLARSLTDTLADWSTP